MRHTPGISEEGFQELKRGWMEDLERPGARTVRLGMREHRELISRRAQNFGTTGLTRFEGCRG